MFLLSVRKQNVFFASGESEEGNLKRLQTQTMLQGVSQPASSNYLELLHCYTLASIHLGEEIPSYRAQGVRRLINN